MKNTFQQFYTQSIKIQPVNKRLRLELAQQLFHPKQNSWNRIIQTMNTMTQSTLMRATSFAAIAVAIVAGVLFYEQPVTAEEIIQNAFAPAELSEGEQHRITRTTQNAETNDVLTVEMTQYDAHGNYWNETRDANGDIASSQLGLAAGDAYELYYFDQGTDEVYHDVVPARGEVNTFEQINADIRKSSLLYNWFLRDESFQQGLYHEPQLREKREDVNGRDAYVIDVTTEYDSTTAWVAVDDYSLLQEITTPTVSEDALTEILQVSSVSNELTDEELAANIDEYAAFVQTPRTYVYAEEFIEGEQMNVDAWSAANNVSTLPVEEKSYVESVEEKALFFTTEE